MKMEGGGANLARTANVTFDNATKANAAKNAYERVNKPLFASTGFPGFVVNASGNE